MDQLPEAFSYAMYRTILDTALTSGFHFIRFDQIEAHLNRERFILLRHDIDYDPAFVLPISQLEHQRSIKATYFFQVNSPFYRIDSRMTVEVIEKILMQDHCLGLHFDANEFPDDTEVIGRIEQVAAYLEHTFHTKVNAVSFHMPTYRRVQHLALSRDRINTYTPYLFEQIEYISDSNQQWRGKDILAILSEQRASGIQLLIHPFWWRDHYHSIFPKLQALAAKLNISVDHILTADQRALL